jgi:hypothetical protein
MLRKSAPLFLLITALPLLAQDADPPSRVARLNLLSGSVSFRPGSVEEWTAATLNYPLTSGDHLWADAASRTEIHVGSTAVRMSERTAMSILNLDDRTTQLSLTEGSLVIRVRQIADDESFEVDTPNVAITLLRPGDYRIDADAENGVTTVSVRGGDAEVTGGGAAFPVHVRQSARAAGTDAVTQEIGPLPAYTEFDEWCDARDRREDQAQISAQYVPRDMAGYEDLDANGTWNEVPDYGWVWRPRVVVADWAPYRFGHWAWVEPWGWTWIDDAPWGFAPFHYGRWAMVAGGWVWVPGRMVVGVRPVYAPALVAFVGGGGVGVAAWFPLGPHEVYRPAYRVSEVYVRQVNITHVTVINNVTTVAYVNQRVPGAVTVVSHETFVSARPVGRSVVAVDTRVIARGPVIGTAAPIAPERVSVLAHVGPAAAAPPARFVDRTVVVRRTPPPPPVSFAAKREALAANPGRPLAPAEVERIRPAMPPRNPMVRTVEPAPRIERPVVRNDRPASFGPPPAQPQPQRVEPARPPRVEAPPAPTHVDRPAPHEERPVVREQRPAAREERKEERKAEKKEKKGEKKEKEDKKQ